MPARLTQLLDLYVDGVLTSQGGEAGRLLGFVTFTAAVSGGLLAAALQVTTDMSWVGWTALVATGLAVVLAIFVFVADRRREPEADRIVEVGLAAGAPEADIIRAVREAGLTALNFNRTVLGRMRPIVALQVTASAVAWVFSVLWLLVGQRA